MPELRQNFFTKEWVIIATERAKRPEELATHRVVEPVPDFVESCPFCPGNESKTLAEVMRTPTNGGPWAVRVIPNKFAALSSEAQPNRSLQHLRRRIEGFGFHEVIIDSPDHSRCMGLCPTRMWLASCVSIKIGITRSAWTTASTTSPFSRITGSMRGPASRIPIRSSSRRP